MTELLHAVIAAHGGLDGRAAAFAFAKDGSRLVVSGRHDEVGQGLAAELRSLGAEVEFIRADVRCDDEVRDLVDRTVACFGRLDAAVNIAGTEGKPGPVTEQTAESYAATFDTNVLGTLVSMKHELRVMEAQRRRQHRQHLIDLRSSPGDQRGVELRGAPYAAVAVIGRPSRLPSRPGRQRHRGRTWARGHRNGSTR
jgi:NAD(P)-dependent dehydrogenase (short-subunit alcohol dehydrogenase family)